MVDLWCVFENTFVLYAFPISSQNNLDYMDDNAERLGRQKMRSDAMKRQFAIQGALNVLYHF
jgi:hypothetical protein